MQRYFVTKQQQSLDKSSNFITLSKEDSFHLKTVMRANIGEVVEVVIEKEAFFAKISSLEPVVSCQILEKIKTQPVIFPKIILAQSLVKEQKMDYILQKSTELGVSEIVPIVAKRSVVKLSMQDTKKVERWRKIVKEASEQSKRISIPNLTTITSLETLATMDCDYKILCSVNETSTLLKRVLQNVDDRDTILIVIGPEGGFDKEEEELLIQNGFISTSLGNRVLRTETASIMVLSVLNYIFMR